MSIAGTDTGITRPVAMLGVLQPELPPYDLDADWTVTDVDIDVLEGTTRFVPARSGVSLQVRARRRSLPQAVGYHLRWRTPNTRYRFTLYPTAADEDEQYALGFADE